MVKWLMAVVVGAGMAYAISRISIYIHLQYVRCKDDDFIVVTVRLPGNIRLYNMKIPMTDLITANGFLWQQSQATTQRNTTGAHQQRLVIDCLQNAMANPRKLYHLLRLFRYYQRMYCSFIRRVLKGMRCEKLLWATTYGFEDAAVTAMSSGVLWGLKLSLVASVRKRTGFTQRPVINVRPVFGQKRLEVDFYCIFSIKLGNLINAAKSIIAFKRGKGVERSV